MATLHDAGTHTWGIGAAETAVDVQSITTVDKSDKKEVKNYIGEVVATSHFNFSQSIDVDCKINGSTGFAAAVIGTALAFTGGNVVSTHGTSAGVFVPDEITTETKNDDFVSLKIKLSRYTLITS